MNNRILKLLLFLSIGLLIFCIYKAYTIKKEVKTDRLIEVYTWQDILYLNLDNLTVTSENEDTILFKGTSFYDSKEYLAELTVKLLKIKDILPQNSYLSGEWWYINDWNELPVIEICGLEQTGNNSWKGVRDTIGWVYPLYKEGENLNYYFQ